MIVLVAARPVHHARRKPLELTGDGVEHRDAPLLGDEQPRLELSQRMREQPSGQVVVDRAVDRVQPPDRQHGEHRRQGVGEERGDPVTGLDAERGETAGKAGTEIEALREESSRSSSP